VLREQGFDGLPHIVSRRELDGYVAAGEVELFRGVREVRHADQLRHGELFVGRGALGGGIYAAGGPDAKDVARVYAEGGPGAILRMTVKAGARIAEARVLAGRAEQEWRRRLSRLSAREVRAIREAFDRSGRAGMIEAAALYNERRLALEALYGNLGRYAAYQGYDAILLEEVQTWLILNRTALRIQTEAGA
jgi:hypothetical protein